MGRGLLTCPIQYGGGILIWAYRLERNANDLIQRSFLQKSINAHSDILLRSCDCLCHTFPLPLSSALSMEQPSGGGNAPAPLGCCAIETTESGAGKPLHRSIHTSPITFLLEKLGRNGYNEVGAIFCCVGGLDSCIGPWGAGNTSRPALYYLGTSYFILLHGKMQGDFSFPPFSYTPGRYYRPHAALCRGCWSMS